MSFVRGQSRDPVHLTRADQNQVDSNSTLFSNDGLTQFGRDIILEMNRLGMLVDLSHVSKQTMLDVFSITKSPVIYSHSSAYSLCNHPRNVQDDVLDLLVRRTRRDRCSPSAFVPFRKRTKV